MAKKKDDEQPEAMKTEYTETTVPVEVGVDKDAMAVAETQNRQVGVDDSKEIRETLHEAAEKHGETVDIPVKMPAGEQLPAAAQQAVDDKAGGVSKSTQAAMPGNASDPDGGGLHTVTINGRTYSWRDGEEGSVPPEAVEVYKQSVEANTP